MSLRVLVSTLAVGHALQMRAGPMRMSAAGEPAIDRRSMIAQTAATTGQALMSVLTSRDRTDWTMNNGTTGGGKSGIAELGGARAFCLRRREQEQSGTRAGRTEPREAVQRRAGPAVHVGVS